MAKVQAMRTITLVARNLLGLAFVVFGLNYFLHFIPQPPPDPAAGAFLGALVAGKVIGLAKIIEITAGLALLSNRFVPLALTLLAPILVNITLFHGVFAPAGIVLPLGLVALELWLAWAYRDAFLPMLQARVAPAASAANLAPAQAKMAVIDNWQ
jgi:putative oxidoreductase